jgi:FMN phosphatase YigB (HAD superfamily)
VTSISEGVRAEPAQALVLFDLDGTLYRSDTGLWDLALRLAQAMPARRRSRYLQRVSQHLSGIPAYPHGDNWEAVVGLAVPALRDATAWSAAFSANRQYLLTRAPVEVPEGLEAWLTWARRRARLLVVSNVPEPLGAPLLQRLGLHPYFHGCYWNAGKPDGLEAVARLWRAPATSVVVAVGDNWTLDIAPGWRAGWYTVHVSPRAVFTGPATRRVRRLEDALGDLTRWVGGSAPAGVSPQGGLSA